jgi:hypothetical protein
MHIERAHAEKIHNLAHEVEKIVHEIYKLTSPTEQQLRDFRSKFDIASTQLLLAFEQAFQQLEGHEGRHGSSLS